MPSDKLNNTPEMGASEKRKIPLELSFEEKENLYFKVLKDVQDYNYSSPSPERHDHYLGLDTPEVMKHLKGLGLLEVVKEFQEKKSSGLTYEDPLRKPHEFEIMARFTLMEIESLLK